MKTTFNNILLLLLTLSLAFPAMAQEQRAEKPNILFILLDDMGKEWVSHYGAQDISTPNVDQLAEEGVAFHNMYSMPQCTPSRVTLLTGNYPWNHGWINHFDVPRWGHGVRFDPEQNVSYAAQLQDLGYATCAAGKWQINDFRIEPEIMNEVGFDAYCMWTGYEAGNPASAERYWDPYIHTKEGSRTVEGAFGEDIFSDFVIDFMKENREQPFMAYYALCLPHGPLVTTPHKPNAKGKMAKHKAMVEYADLILEKMVNALEELGLRDNTIIVWTTDNGTAGVAGHRDGRLVQGGKTFLTENGINAPFIMNCPARLEAKALYDVADFSDVFPTFIEMAGGNAKAYKHIDGQSFWPQVQGQKNKDARQIIGAAGSHPAYIAKGRMTNAHQYRDRVLRTERYKVFVDTSGSIYALYDVVADPEEINNLLDTPNRAQRKLLKQFRKQLKQMPAVDALPRYQSSGSQPWDIDTLKLYKMSMDKKVAPNRRPVKTKRHITKQ